MSEYRAYATGHLGQFIRAVELGYSDADGLRREFRSRCVRCSDFSDGRGGAFAAPKEPLRAGCHGFLVGSFRAGTEICLTRRVPDLLSSESPIRL